MRLHGPLSNTHPPIILPKITLPKITLITDKTDIRKLSNVEQWCCPNCKGLFKYDDPWLVEKEAAQLVRFDHETLSKWRYLEKYGIPFVRIGRSIRYPLSGILRFKAELKRKMRLQLMP
jgi:hypothetical protein